MSDQGEAADEIRGFAKQVATVLVVGISLTGYPVYVSLGGSGLTAALVGCAISTLNVIAGVVSIVWAFDKPQPIFLKTILGGMAARMAAIFVILIGVVTLTDLDVVSLVGSMFGYYIVFQALELLFVTRRRQPDTDGV
tara:strand:+ start:222 stop:635 length:414 start_codon:yes stop_codon:yes gene_type:complete